MATLTERIMGAITFDKGILKEIAESDDATSQAWMLIFLSLIIGAVLTAISAYLEPKAVPMFEMLVKSETTGIAMLIAALIIYLVFYFIFIYIIAAVLAFVGRGFGGKLSTAECIRIIGFSSVLILIPGAILTFLGAVVLPDLASTFNLVGSIFSLWGFVVFLYGYSLGAEISIIMAFIAVIIAAVLAVILAFVVVFIIMMILAITLLAALSSSMQTSLFYISV